jgi:hypothetical protein
VNGWLIQAFNLNDPTMGESVSNAFGVIDVFPVRRRPLFVRGGGGATFYENRRPFESNSHGVGGTIGLGFEHRVARYVSIAPIVQYSAGTLGNVDNIIQWETGRTYSVIEAKVSFGFHFGRATAR